MLDINNLDFEAGEVLLIDKPLGWTSFDVVNKLRYAIKIKKIGHAGTLDPLATGLLIICTGKFTKRIEEFQAQEKEYIGTITLGATTPTYDAEMPPENLKSFAHLTQNEILNKVDQFIGDIEQLPPMFSAIKVNGKKLYELARKGKEIELKPRNVSIFEFEITRIELPLLEFRIVCSKGTYIRSIANDLGKALGVGGYLSSLRRTKIGDFQVKNSYQLLDFIEIMRDFKTNKVD